MKKLVALLLMIILCFTLGACKQETPQGSDSSQRGTEQSSGSATFSPISCEFKTQVIRTNGGDAGGEYPSLYVISTKNELERYYDRYARIYDFSHKETVYSDTTIGFVDAIKKYDDGWFKTNQLILVVQESTSGSVNYEVESVTTSATDEGIIKINELWPEEFTCDMGQWHIIIELEKDTFQKSDEIQVEFTQKPMNEE